MGRELRRVTADWQHPKSEYGNYIPLFDGEDFIKELSNWEEGKRQWDLGFKDNFKGGWEPKEQDELNTTFEEWDGQKPLKEDYMPVWTEEEKTHIQLYENTSEGTPNSPVYRADQLMELCAWCEKNATTIGYNKTTKEKWFEMLSQDFVHHTNGNVTWI